MEENVNPLQEKVEELYKQSKFDEIIALLTDELLEIQMDADLYIWLGTTWYNKKNYDEAIDNYNKAIKINPNYELAFYDRGLAKIAKGEYTDAIEDCDTVVKFNPNYIEAYISRGRIRIFFEEYNLAIEDFNEAIKRDSVNANAYYNRGLAYYNKALKGKRINTDLFKNCKEDCEKYIELTPDEKDNDGVKYARHYIEESKVMIKDPYLFSIKQLVNNIKDKLWIKKENCITHYTSFSVLKKLILEESRFWISEGNFMNDPSEGEVFFDFMEDKPDAFRKNNSSTETFSPKPFIGSFVSKEKYNDLNMWRFYGKEKGEDAKGCSITLRMQEFIEDIKDSLSDEKNKKARLDDESDINFYRVVYLPLETTELYIPDLDINKDSQDLIVDQNNELKNLMEELRKKVKSYKGKDKTSLEECLNNIAFLFKSNAYKNENEVRLVMKGIEFEKKYCEENKEDKTVNPPRVYIELEPIKKRVEQITLGPKVDNANEWASAFHFSYKGEVKAPKIMISHLPYK